MEVNISKEGKAIIAKIVGRLDTVASQESAHLFDPIIGSAGGKIILDCSELTYISSSGLRIFLTIRKASIAQGGSVVIRDINDDIRKVFMMTGFLGLFEIESSK